MENCFYDVKINRDCSKEESSELYIKIFDYFYMQDISQIAEFALIDVESKILSKFDIINIFAQIFDFFNEKPYDIDKITKGFILTIHLLSKKDYNDYIYTSIISKYYYYYENFYINIQNSEEKTKCKF